MKKHPAFLLTITTQFLLIFTLLAAVTINVAAQPDMNQNLAQAHKDEPTVPAIKLLKLAAENGDAESQTQLALRYAIGDGVTKDPAKAIALLGKAAKQGHEQALDLLHWMSQAAH